MGATVGTGGPLFRRRRATAARNRAVLREGMASRTVAVPPASSPMTTTGTASRLLRVVAVAVAVAIASWLVVSAQRRANPPEPAEAPAAAGESRSAPAPASAPAEGQQPAPARRRPRRTVIQAHLESCSLVVRSVATATEPAAVLPPTAASLAPTPQPARRDQ